MNEQIKKDKSLLEQADEYIASDTAENSGKAGGDVAITKDGVEAEVYANLGRKARVAAWAKRTWDGAMLYAGKFTFRV